MPSMAPRPPGKPASKGPSSASTKEGSAARKARNRAAAAGGSIKTSITRYPSLDWEEVEDVVEHITDLAATIAHCQVGSTGNVVSSINCPTAYAHAALEAHLASADGMVYIRVYRVGREKFVAKQQRIAEAAALLEQQMEVLEFGTQLNLDDDA